MRETDPWCSLNLVSCNDVSNVTEQIGHAGGRSAAVPGVFRDRRRPWKRDRDDEFADSARRRAVALFSPRTAVSFSYNPISDP